MRDSSSMILDLSSDDDLTDTWYLVSNHEGTEAYSPTQTDTMPLDLSTKIKNTQATPGCSADQIQAPLDLRVTPKKVKHENRSNSAESQSTEAFLEDLGPPKASTSTNTAKYYDDCTVGMGHS